MSIRNGLLIAGVFIAGILLKKAGWTLGVLLLYGSLILLIYSGIRIYLRERSCKNATATLLACMIYWVAISMIQYRFRADAADGWIAFTSLIIAITLLRLWKPFPVIILTLVPMFIILIAGATDFRTFHNTFHSLPFESYIRSHYTYTERAIADSIIVDYSRPDPEAAERMMLQARHEQEVGNNEAAEKLYNTAIDLDPSVSKFYDERGYFRLSTHTLEMPNIFDALKDFERACQLDTTNGSSLFHHAQCLSMMNRNEQACREFKKVRTMDSTLNIVEFEKKCCK